MQEQLICSQSCSRLQDVHVDSTALASVSHGATSAWRGLLWPGGDYDVGNPHH